MSKYTLNPSWDWLLHNFHKLSENKKVRVALCLITTGKKPKRLILELRDRNNKKNTDWRKEVFKRDNYTCQECGQKGYIEAHHIKRWVDYPNLRYDINNGKTLCKSCHSKTTKLNLTNNAFH
jgi:hypothetical protein